MYSEKATVGTGNYVPCYSVTTSQKARHLADWHGVLAAAALAKGTEEQASEFVQRGVETYHSA